METTETKKESLLEKLFSGAIDAIKKPFTVSKIERAFASAKDSLAEQLIDCESSLFTKRESLVNDAKADKPLKCNIQDLIDLQNRIIAVKESQRALEIEIKELLG